MTSKRSRLAIGCILMLTVGVFGPISRAVSMESRRLVEVTAPAGEGQGTTAAAVGHGADANIWLSRPGGSGDQITLIVEERVIARDEHHEDGTTASVDRFDRAILFTTTCQNYQCGERVKHSGFGAFEIDALGRTFSGTLFDPDGVPCEVTARWDLSVMTLAGRAVGAPGNAQTDCFGDFTWGHYDGRIYPIGGQYLG